MSDSMSGSANRRPAFRDSEMTPKSVDGSRAVPVPIVITRAESLAIAQAMIKRMAAKPKSDVATDTLVPSSRTSVLTSVGPGTQRIIVRTLDDPKAELALDRQWLLDEVKRIFTDSISQALARMESDLSRMPRGSRTELTRVPAGIVPLIAPPSDGRTRVVISTYTNGTGKREFGGIGRDAAQFLRASLAPDKFDVIDTETTDRVSRSTGDRLSMGWGLRADYVVSGVVTQRADSLVLLTILTDMRGRFSRASEIVSPNTDVKKAFDPTLARLNLWLDSAKVMSARMPPRPPRGAIEMRGSQGPGGPTAGVRPPE